MLRDDFLAKARSRILQTGSFVRQWVQEHPFHAAFIVFIFLLNRNYLYLAFVGSILLIIWPFLKTKKQKLAATGLTVFFAVSVPGGSPVMVHVPDDLTGRPLATHQEVMQFHPRWTVDTPVSFHFPLHNLQEQARDCGAVTDAVLLITGWDLDFLDVRTDELEILSRATTGHGSARQLRIRFRIPETIDSLEIPVTLAPLPQAEKHPALLIGPNTDGTKLYPEAVMIRLQTPRCRIVHYASGQGENRPQPRAKLLEAGR